MILTAFDSIVKDSNITWWKILLILSLATIYGFITGALYKFFKKREGFEKDLPLSLILMPIGVAAIVYISRIIGLENEAARTTLGFSFAGILCITRFRSTQKDATDLVFLSSSIILGFLLGFGYILYSAIVEALILIVVLIVYFTKFNLPDKREYNLKVVIPEALNFDNLFDDLLKEYTTSWIMKSVKSQDFGTMFEIAYVIILKDSNKQKEFMDKIRERNGNLYISLSIRRFNQ